MLYLASGRAVELSVIKNIPYLAVGLPESTQFAMAGVPMAPSVAVEGHTAEEWPSDADAETPLGIFH